MSGGVRGSATVYPLSTWPQLAGPFVFEAERMVVPRRADAPA
jgi:hypothetical protein